MSAKKSGGGGGSAKKGGSKKDNDSSEEVYELRDVVLGKLRGFPPWPGMVVDPEKVPKSVAKERPANKKTVVHAIRFFPTGDYAWLPPRELSRLTQSDITAFLEAPANAKKPKGGEIMEAYRKALDPEAWEADHAANPPPAKKSKKKSKKSKKADDDEDEEEGGEDEDELEADAAEGEGEDEGEDEKPSKKRKRASSPAAKTKSKPKAPAAKGSKKGGKAKKSKAAVESEDEGGEEGGEEEAEGEAPASKKHKGPENASTLESDPEALKVREWRHKLQKTFLSSNKALPKEDEMPAVDTLFTTVESYQNMNIDYLTFSKIGKVMRHIHLLEPHKVPRDDEFKFRDRAKALVDKWHQILNANKVPEGADGVSAAGIAAPAEAAGESAAAADVNGEGDLTVMDVTMDES